MLDATVRKWAALRRLYERHGAPVDMLADASSLTRAGVTRQAARSRWRAGGPVHDLLADLTSVCSAQVNRLKKPAGGSCEEKLARTVASAARTLETLAAIKLKLEKAADDGDGTTDGGPGDRAAGVEPGEAVELERRLGALVAALGEPGGSD